MLKLAGQQKQEQKQAPQDAFDEEPTVPPLEWVMYGLTESKFSTDTSAQMGAAAAGMMPYYGQPPMMFNQNSLYAMPQGPALQTADLEAILAQRKRGF